MEHLERLRVSYCSPADEDYSAASCEITKTLIISKSFTKGFHEVAEVKMERSVSRAHF